MLRLADNCVHSALTRQRGIEEAEDLFWLDKAENWMREKLDKRSGNGDDAVVPYEELLDEVTRRQRAAAAGGFDKLASYRVFVALDRLRYAGLKQSRSALDLAVQLRQDINARLGVDKAHEYDWTLEVVDGCSPEGLYQIEAVEQELTRKFSRTACTEPALARPPAFVLKALAGPAAGTEIRFCKAVITIGRSKEQDFCLFDDSASRLHAYLRCEDGRFVLCDADSLNGTYLNGKRIVRAGLQTGDAIRMGQSILSFAEVQD